MENGTKISCVFEQLEKLEVTPSFFHFSHLNWIFLISVGTEIQLLTQVKQKDP